MAKLACTPDKLLSLASPRISREDYRVYFGKDGDTLIILLGGGTKKRQQRDIEAARGNLELWPGDTGPNALGVGEVTLLHPDQGYCHLGRRPGDLSPSNHLA